MTTIPHLELRRFCRDLLIGAGLPHGRAQICADIFVEADLLGFVTHGVARLPSNLEWILAGDTEVNAEPTVLVDRGAVLSWDANNLPGPFVISQAIEVLILRSRLYGQSSIVIHRAQHIACLAAYLLPVTLQGLMIQMLCATPGDQCVSPYGGVDRIFSPNPFAFAAPTGGDPVLIDMSLSTLAEGQLVRARQENRRLEFAALKTNAGQPSDDPEAYWGDPPASLMPIGGLEHGYKGYALTLWSEIMTLALGNYGRADELPYSESNSVYIQITDPSAFGDPEKFAREIDYTAALCRQSAVKAGDPPVRVPGERALAQRRRQLASGVELRPHLVNALAEFAGRLNVTLPESFKCKP